MIKKLVLIALLMLPIVFGNYPAIVTSEGMNHTIAKELVYSVPEHYYKHVDKIEFHIDYRIESFWVPNGPGWGYAFADSYWIHNQWQCVGGFIDLEYNVFNSDCRKFILMHELGHMDEFCNQHKEYSSEEDANDFAYTYLGERRDMLKICNIG